MEALYFACIYCQFTQGQLAKTTAIIFSTFFLVSTTKKWNIKTHYYEMKVQKDVVMSKYKLFGSLKILLLQSLQ